MGASKLNVAKADLGQLGDNYAPFANPMAMQIWDMKYRLKDLDGNPIDQTVHDTWSRIAKTLASVESDPWKWEPIFYRALENFSFIPAGRINAGAGTDRNVTLFNCLSADTEIVTAEYGLVKIGEIAGESVHVIDGNGDWVLSPINSFGEQQVAPVSLIGGYNGRQKQVVYATSGHRWIMQDGSEKTTEQLSNGDALIPVCRTDVDASSDEYISGVQHGVMYGDGTRGYGDKFTIRLCGEKSELSSFFSGWYTTMPPSSGGDVHYFGSNGRDMKSLPSGESVEYMTGFIRGWMAADGAVCKRDGKAILSCGKNEVEWIKSHGAISGFEFAYATKLPETTNYGRRNKSIYNVSFKRHTLIEQDFLRTKHRENFKPTHITWMVESVGDYGDPEPVFCPRVLTTDSVQLANGVHTGQCFVMGTIPDSLTGIMDALKEAALTMQAGGGIGYDFSTLRPAGAPVKGVAADASGPLTFMDVWDAMCRTIMSAGVRRGAMMATMRVDHPDIFRFVDAKRDPLRLRMFNVSVLVTDEFMQAVKDNAQFPLRFEGKVYKTVSARGLWDHITQATYAYAEPGVIFIDRINQDNNLSYCETIAATNPCGEQPLPPYGACLLGSINLAAMLTDNFEIDRGKLRETIRVAVRMMDNVVDASRFPLPEQEAEAKAKRRIGLGVTGLADALALGGIVYGSDEAVAWTDKIMKTVAVNAYQASIDLAKEKGAFPLIDVDAYLESGNMRKMPEPIREGIRRHGIRNALLTSIAPTGTISLYAGNVSSGIEPIFALEYDRKVMQKDGSKTTETVHDYAVDKWKREFGDELPESFVTAQTLKPIDHVKMQAAAQKWVDSSISKTINCPEDISFDDFKDVYLHAWEMGCKGCTTYRPNDVTGSVLEAKPEKDEGGSCELRHDPETGQLIRSCE
jgi:adenosylcobalamin-dependent ribonucleoside-diphosphate reductase